jgi:membrane protein
MAQDEPKPTAESRNFRRILGLRLKDTIWLLRESAVNWNNDNAQRLSASLAFYTVLSLAPLLVVIIAVAAVVFGREAAEGQLAWEIHGIVGMNQALAIEAVIRAALRPGGGWIATLLSLVTLAVGATSVVVELQDALNYIWHVPNRGSNSSLSGVAGLLKQRIYSFVMVLCAGFLLMVSLALSAWVAAMGRFFGSIPPIHESSLHILTFLLSFLVITFLFASIYKIMPDVELRWSDVLAGASVTSLTFTAGKQLIALYLGKAAIGSSYGAAGSVVLVLVWVYYSAQLFFFGAEFTKVYASTYGSQLVAQPDAVPAKPELAEDHRLSHGRSSVTLSKTRVL